MNESHDNYFKFFATKILTKIHGKPNYSQLKNLKDHLKVPLVSQVILEVVHTAIMSLSSHQRSIF